MARQTEELERLYRASGALLSSAPFDLQGLAQTIVQVIQHEFGQANCSLFLVQEGSSELNRIAVAGPYADQVRKAQLTLDGHGQVPKAMRSGKVINVPDVTVISAYVPNWDAARAELTIPLVVNERVIGAVDIQSASANAFSANDVRLMSVFAERAVLALEHARLYAEKERRMQNIASLRAIDRAISSSFDIHFTLGVLLDQVTQQLGVDAADVLVFSPVTQTLRYSQGQGFRTRALQQIDLWLDDKGAGRVARERQIVTIQDLDKNSAGLKRAAEFLSEGFVTYVGAPLITKGQVRGVLEIFQRKARTLDHEQQAFLEMLAGQAAIAVDSAELFESLQGSNAELTMAYDETIEGWSHAMDLRDEETEGHTQRVTGLTLQLASKMGFGIEELVNVRRGALLHDIGKIGVPDAILLKPGPLTDQEWVIMRKHPQFAYDMLASITYLRKAVDIPYCHHEKWDGTGYPRGLKGEQIPWAARIFAVVDVWDAITSDRPYRKAWSNEEALAYIREQAGRHFDPKVVKLFLEHLSRDGREALPSAAPTAGPD
jgi:putative nucleotidyltransferase with HDIG domain